jgi:hypothetical protein
MHVQACAMMCDLFICSSLKRKNQGMDNLETLSQGDPRCDASLWTPALVEERMVDAVDKLDRVVSSGRYPFAKDGPWSSIIRDRLVDYVDVDDLRERGARGRGGLRSAEVDLMNEALEWVTLLPAKGRNRPLVGVVLIQRIRGGSQIDWADVKRRLRSKDGHDTLRMAYGRSLSGICRALNRRRVPVSL